MKRSHVGYRAGYHPSPSTLHRLRVHERTPSKSARNYLDPVTGRVYSKRAVQEAKQGFLRIETARDLRKRPSIAEGIRKARESGVSIITMANRYRHQHEMTLEATLQSSKFWNRIADSGEYLHKRIEVFGEGDTGSVSESEARQIWADGDYDAWDDDLAPYSDVDDFFAEFDDRWLGDLLDDFGMDDVAELGYYH